MILVVTTIIGIASTPAFAGPTATFELSTFDTLRKGEPKGTLISSDGEVVPGFGSRALKIKDAALMYWSRAKAADGTLYLGSGKPAKIFALKDGRLRTVADLQTILVSALAMGPGGKLLAATLPDARILEVDPGSGKWRELGRLPSRHVWDLLYDAKAGRIYAAGGAPGKVYSLPAGGGKPTVYYDPSEKHLLCLALDRKGLLLTGGSGKAILYRVLGKGRAEAIHDFAGSELRRIVVAADGTLYVAVNKFQRRMAGLPRYDRPRKGRTGTAIVAKKGAKLPRFRAAELRPGAKQGKGGVFRIEASGRVTQLHGLAKGYFTDLGIDSTGQLWAAEGTKGKVFLMRGDKVMTAFDVDERQVLVLDVTGKTKVFATGDAGAIYTVTDTPQGKPIYQTQPLDAKYVANWGTVRYLATAPLAISSRSGNTAKADKTWGPWSAAKKEGKQLVRLTSKPARYLQVRATWQGKGALRSLEAYYRAQNQPPEVTAITFERNEKKPEDRKIKIKWKTENPDKDKLVYRIYYREELGASWRLLEEKPTDKIVYEWDTTGFADDTYRIKIVASDEAVNGPTTALTHSLVSAPIIVDNRKPDVTGLKVAYPYVTGLAKDGYSAIKKIEYALDGGDWKVIDTLDGIYDSTAEAFRILLPAIKRGSHTLAVRVTDSADNIGVRQLRFVR